MRWHPHCGVSPDAARRDLTWRGEARSGEARRAYVSADDLSTGGFGLLCLALRSSDVVRRGLVRLGEVGSGGVSYGPIKHGLRQQHWELRLPLLLSLRADLACRGEAGLCKSRRGLVRRGMARQGLQTAVRRLRPPYCSLGNRYGPAS